MVRFDPSKLKPDWGIIKHRPTWAPITMMELATVLNMPHQNLANHKLRGHLPPPITDHKLKGNKVWYRVSVIKSWIESRPENEIHWEWIHNHIPYDIETLQQAEYVVNNANKLLNVEKSPIPANFSN